MKNDITLVIPSSKNLLYVKIADAIHNYIRQNDLKPGDRLPSERALSEQLKVGRHSVREALRVLENEGIIEVRIGCGTFISESVHPDSFYLEVVRVNYQELLSIKTELEKYAIREAIKKATDEQLAHAEKILSDLEKGWENGLFLSETDKSFHRFLISLSGNKMLMQMIDKMIESFEDYYKVLPKNEPRCLDTVPLHRQLLDAIKTHNVPRAEEIYDLMKEINMQRIHISDMVQKNFSKIS